MRTDQHRVVAASVSPFAPTGDAELPAVAPDRHFDHRVQFYEADAFLYRALADFFFRGREEGEPLAVFATSVHRRGFCEHLRATGVDVDGLFATGQLTLFDAQETLASFMVDGLPDVEQFNLRVGMTVARLTSGSRTGRLRVFGEMVDLLWSAGNVQATIALESLWKEAGRDGALSLLCGYDMAHFGTQRQSAHFHELCDAHVYVSPTEAYLDNTESQERLQEVALLQQRARALEGEIEHRKRLESALREALIERGRAEQALRSSQQELTDFFENAAEGLHSAGADGVILSANRAELEMLGYAREEYVGHHVAEFHVDPDVVTRIFASLERNETVKDCEARLRCKDGVIKNVVIHSNAYFRDGQFIHTRCFTRDVSDRKKLEDELRRQNGELLRTVHFSEMFVGILGHDLRNPLSAIATAGSLLQRRADSEKLQKPITRILSSVARMGRMIDQLLDFTRIRLGSGIPIQASEVDLRDVCGQALDEFEHSSHAQALKCEVVGDSRGMWDADRLLQLVSNLLGNALAHGEPSGLVTIRVDGTHANWVALEIRNTGVVPAGLLPVLFEPFRGATNLKQERSNGLGLGLFISQQIVQGHRGTIDVFSSEGEGTRLVVRIPRDPLSYQNVPAEGVQS